MGEEADDTFVWGTNLTVSSICSRVRRFLQHFKTAPEDAEPKYISLLAEVSWSSARSAPLFEAPTSFERLLCRCRLGACSA